MCGEHHMSDAKYRESIESGETDAQDNPYKELVERPIRMSLMD